MAFKDKETTKKQGQPARAKNPKEKEPQPPFAKQSQPAPGQESRMQPQPDYGEKS